MAWDCCAPSPRFRKVKLLSVNWHPTHWAGHTRGARTVDEGSGLTFQTTGIDPIDVDHATSRIRLTASRFDRWIVGKNKSS